VPGEADPAQHAKHTDGGDHKPDADGDEDHADVGAPQSQQAEMPNLRARKCDETSPLKVSATNSSFVPDAFLATLRDFKSTRNIRL